MTVQPLTPEVARELELTGRREGVVIRDVILMVQPRRRASGLATSSRR